MGNLISIFVVVFLVWGVIKVFFMARRRKKRKTGFQRNLWKIKLAVVMLLTGMFWCPLTIVYCVRNPQNAIIYSAKMGLVALRIKGDIVKTFKRANNKVNKTLDPYTPTVGKKVVKVAKKSYNRYGIRDTQRIVSATGSQVGVKIYKPKPSLFEKVSNGIVNTVKIICSPVIRLFGA